MPKQTQHDHEEFRAIISGDARRVFKNQGNNGKISITAPKQLPRSDKSAGMWFFIITFLSVLSIAGLHLTLFLTRGAKNGGLLTAFIIQLTAALIVLGIFVIARRVKRDNKEISDE